MIRRLVFRQEARLEFDQAGDWYEAERRGLGQEFLDEIDRLLQSIRVSPQSYPLVVEDVHKAVAKRFPYSVYFRQRSDLIVVLAIFHSARNPAHWQRRT